MALRAITLEQLNRAFEHLGPNPTRKDFQEYADTGVRIPVSEILPLTQEPPESIEMHWLFFKPERLQYKERVKDGDREKVLIYDATVWRNTETKTETTPKWQLWVTQYYKQGQLVREENGPAFLAWLDETKF